MRVLITGASGFVGEAVTAVLRREHELRLFDLAPGGGQPDRLAGDVADFGVVTNAVEGMDAVVHLGVAAGVGAYDTPELPTRVNAQGTANVLEAARRAGIRRIVHVGDRAA